jgi:succinate dehydrogenase / fumarate reductase cytochrome b subunit
MALLGLFLVVFLFVHLGINFLLLFSKDWFNIAAHFMATNPVIKVFEVVLFAGFIFHIVYGIILYFQNTSARPVNYKVKFASEKSYFSKYMIHTAVIILIFLIFHLISFYFTAKFGEIGHVTIDGEEYHDMATLVLTAFHNLMLVLFNVFVFLILGFHLNHGFQSAFQSMGWNHPKYTPFVMALGRLISVILTIGFVSIPLIVYFGNIN